MEYKELIELKKNICNNYLETYLKKGYVINPPLPLDNKEDITLDYTTCTICSAKKNIFNNIIGQNYVMIQPALRNTHIETLGNVNDSNPYFSFFTMIGGYHYYDKGNYIDEFSDVIKTEYSFLSQYVEAIILTIPIQYKELLELNKDCINYLNSQKCKIIYSSNDEENLKWKYGIDGVTGYGTRWELVNGGEVINFGNTINVYKNNMPVGVDFGGGLETLIFAHKNLKSSIYANSALTDDCKLFCEESSLNEKMIDCIVSSMCIISSKEKIILRDRVLLDKYMRILNSLAIIQNVSKDKILYFVKDIEDKKIEILNRENITEIFDKYYSRAEEKFSILIYSKSIDDLIKLMDLCYNEDNSEWMRNKKILLSRYEKYFNNLFEVDFLAIKKKKKLIFERGEKND